MMAGEDDRRVVLAAQDFAFNYLSYRSRSCKEVYDRLRRKGYSEEVASEVVEYLTKRRYLDDRKFAEEWADFSVGRKLMGRILLTHELRRKGISADIIEEVVRKTYEPEDRERGGRERGDRERELAVQLLQKQIRRSHKQGKGGLRGEEDGFREEKDNQQKEKLRLINLLARHGFSHAIIQEVITEFLGSSEE